MEKEENTVAGTVEEKDKAEAVATETKATDSDVDIININEEENKAIYYFINCCGSYRINRILDFK